MFFCAPRTSLARCQCGCLTGWLALLQFIANQKAYKDAFALEPPRMKSFGPEYNFAADDDRWMGSWLTKPDETTKSK